MADRTVERIVAAIADAEGTHPTELDLSLGEHVDAASLQRFGERTDAPWRLRLELPEHFVVVDADGTVEVTVTRAEADSAG